MIERLTAGETVERIRALQQQDQLILGVDGFRSVPGGYVASLDLILDLSTRALSVNEAASQAEQFVAREGGDDVTFEIVS